MDFATALKEKQGSYIGNRSDDFLFVMTDVFV